jgi:N utilization substance protein A
MAEKPSGHDFLNALSQLKAERGLGGKEVVEAIEAALLHAYRREYGIATPTRIDVDPSTGQPHIYEIRTVTLVYTDQPDTIPLAAARKLRTDVSVGEKVELPVEMPAGFGRVAAHTCKQVILQKMREVERDHVFDEFVNQESELVSGIIQHIQDRSVYVLLGKTEAVLPPAEQVAGEQYRAGQRRRFYLLEVHRTPKGPQVVLSRAHRGFLKRLLEMETPEIHDGTVEIRGIAREAGSRSKVAVWARQEDIDPIGACVGLRSTRIQNVLSEIVPEKIDLVTCDLDPATFVAQALSPARVVDVTIDEAHRRASVSVPADQMSLAIGKEGQNARLAAKLTGWKIDIHPADQEDALLDDEERVTSLHAVTNGGLR